MNMINVSSVAFKTLSCLPRRRRACPAGVRSMCIGERYTPAPARCRRTRSNRRRSTHCMRRVPRRMGRRKAVGYGGHICRKFLGNGSCETPFRAGALTNGRPCCKLVRLPDCSDSAGFCCQGHSDKAGALHGASAPATNGSPPGQRAAWHGRLLCRAC